MGHQKETSWSPMASPESARYAGISFEIDHIPTLTREVIRDELRIFASEHLVDFKAEVRKFISQAKLHFSKEEETQILIGQTYARKCRPCSPIQSQLQQPLPSLMEGLNTCSRSNVAAVDRTPRGVLTPLTDMPNSNCTSSVRYAAQVESKENRCNIIDQSVEPRQAGIIYDTSSDRYVHESGNDETSDVFTIPGATEHHVAVTSRKSYCDRTERGMCEYRIQSEGSAIVAERGPCETRRSTKSSTSSSYSRASLREDPSDGASADGEVRFEQPVRSLTPAGARHVGSMSKKMFRADIPSLSLTEKRKVLWLVNHQVFDYVIASLILLNGLLVGAQTDWNARRATDTAPLPFQVTEIIFCAVFTGELCLRLFAYRCTFFTMSSRWWNLFDLFVVSAQLFEIFMSAVAAGVGYSFNLLRILRLIRVIRLARALRLIGELRTIVSSIAGSFRPLFWTCVLLLMVVYVLGVYFTQVVLNKRISLQEEGSFIPRDLDKYWGSLVPAIFSLFCSITGGLDWEVAVRPLIEHVSPEMGIVYVLYITFTVFAVLNVVTGVFIESVMKHANTEAEMRTAANVQQLFKHLDVDNKGEITWENFQQSLHKAEMMAFFRTIDVDISHARNLFEVLDVDGSGTINAAEFMDGCLRIWSPSKGLDLRVLLRDVNRVAALVEERSWEERGGTSCSAAGRRSSQRFIQPSAVNQDNSRDTVTDLEEAATEASRAQEYEPEPHRHPELLN